MRSILVWVGILGGVIPTTAQTTPSNIFGDTIVVTASLSQEPEDDLPATVDVVGRDEITHRQATAVLDLLATLPSMSVVRSGSPGQVTSLFTRGTESNHTLALWDGVVLNDPYFGGFNWAFQATDGVERVEVVRGPFSSLYGGDAVGGVVQILTDGREGVHLDLEAGQNSYARAGITGGVNIGALELDIAGHLRRGEGEVDNDDFDSEEARLKADWELSPGIRLGLALRALDADTGIAYSGGAPSPNRRISWQERLIAIPFHFEGEGAWQVDAQVSSVSYDNAFRDPDDPFGYVASDTASEVLRGRAVASYDLEKTRSWIAFGGEADDSSVTDSSVFGQNLDGVGQRNWAVFTEIYYSLGQFTVDVGLRHDENNIYGGQTSPRLGLQWNATDRTRVWVAYGQAFAPPAVGELFFPGSGNPDLEPESSTSVEVGAEHREGGWRFTLTGYDYELDNLIDFDFVEFRNVNIGQARTRGVEAEIAYGREHWGARWNASYLDAEDLTTGLPLLRRPPESSSVVLTYAPSAWSMTFTGRYVGDRDDVDPISLERRVNDSYLRLDLAARWQALGWLAPYARIENLTDTSYAEALGFPAPGLSLIGGISLSYR